VIIFTQWPLSAPGKDPPPLQYPLDRRLDRLQGQSGCCAEEKFLTLSGLKPWPLGCPAWSQLLYWLHFPKYLYNTQHNCRVYSLYRNIIIITDWEKKIWHMALVQWWAIIFAWVPDKSVLKILNILTRNTFFLFNYCIFTIYSRYLKRVISKRDRCEYLKQVPSIDGSLELI
jgi:hypothetical protein